MRNKDVGRSVLLVLLISVLMILSASLLVVWLAVSVTAVELREGPGPYYPDANDREAYITLALLAVSSVLMIYLINKFAEIQATLAGKPHRLVMTCIGSAVAVFATLFLSWVWGVCGLVPDTYFLLSSWIRQIAAIKLEF